MSESHRADLLEGQIEQWRNYVRRRQAIHSVDVSELEDHLREQVAALVSAGLATDEAFLVAVKRMGDLDSLSREFAREHSDRLWKQLMVVPSDSTNSGRSAAKDAIVAFGLAISAALLTRVPALFGITTRTHEAFYMINAAFFVLPLLTGYFAWKRRLDHHTTRWLGLAFIAAGSIANLYPFVTKSATHDLAALHLPIMLWLLVGVAYAGGRWNEVNGRMDFIRFSGELFIYFVLIGLGGGVLTAFGALIFKAIGIDIEPFFESWLAPCGAAAAVIVASWLVEAKQSVIENMAPVLTRLFTPLFAVVLVVFLGTMIVTGRGVAVDRDLLIAFDALLAVVIALLLYSVSARDPLLPPGTFDLVQLILIVSALLADALALWAIAARISEFGFTPNRVAALGENVILLVNLAGSAVLFTRFLRKRSSFARIEQWQTGYLPVYAGWAAIVVIAFPPLFRFL